MFSIIIFVLLVTGVTVNCEVHSLTYIYTALSKPVGLPGIHEFTAMGLLDNKMIDYFDSQTQKKVPKQDWMKKRLNNDYWERGTEFLKREQQRLRNQSNISMERMGQNDSDIHVLQRMYRCKADIQPDGEKKSSSGMLMYNYNGNNIWSFNSISGVWVRDEAAGEAKMKWDDAPILNENTVGLEKECLKWLNKFVLYGHWQLKAAPPPEVFMFTQKAKVETNVILTCLATGFYPKDIVLQIKRNGRVLTREDGVVSSGVRPNGDDTYQQRDHVEILERDESVYTCEVKHEASRLHVEKEWDRTLPDGPNGVIIGGAVVGVVLLVIIGVVALVIVYLKKRSNGAGQKQAKHDNNDETNIPLTEMKGAADRRARDAMIIQTLNKCLAEMEGAADQRVRDDDIIQTLNKCLAEMKGAADRRARDDDIIQTLNKRLAEMEDQRARDDKIIQMLNKCLAEMKDANNDETNTRLAEMKDDDNNDPTNIPLIENKGSDPSLSTKDSGVSQIP